MELGAVPTIPDQPGGVDPEEPEEPEMPEDPEEPEPEEPDQPKPDVPVAPVIKVDVTLIEKDYVIEIPSNFVENSKPGTGGGDTPSTPGEGGTTDPSNPEVSNEVTITGKIDGKSFDVNQTQTVSDNTKSVVINLYLPTGLEALTVDVSIGSIFLPLDLLNASSVADINGILAGMGKTLNVPAKGSKGNLTFDISAFMGMLDTNNSFKLYVKDKNGKSATATIKLTKK